MPTDDAQISTGNSISGPADDAVTEPQLAPITTDKEVRAAWLAPFQYRQGVSGNPGGRPRKKPVAEAMEFASSLPCPPRERLKLEKQLGVTLPKNLSLGQAVAVGQLVRGIKNTETARWLADKIDGPLAAEIRLAASPDAPLPPVIPGIIFQFCELAADLTPRRVIDLEPPPPIGEEPHQAMKPTPAEAQPTAIVPLKPKPPTNGNGTNGPTAA
jgi:hypothetical protein